MLFQHNAWLPAAKPRVAAGCRSPMPSIGGARELIDPG
jgi:hypothetical protein